MITPFRSEKAIINGKSAGLGPASYDARIAQDLVLGPNPSVLLQKMLISNPKFDSSAILDMYRQALVNYPPYWSLASTIEDFAIPDNVCGYVVDKSTYARYAVSLFNTLFDPGFVGNATLEIVNLGTEMLELKAGDPICQFAFHWLDKKTKIPYRGKYSGQKGPTSPILEKSL